MNIYAASRAERDEFRSKKSVKVDGKLASVYRSLCLKQNGLCPECKRPLEYQLGERRQETSEALRQAAGVCMCEEVQEDG